MFPLSRRIIFPTMNVDAQIRFLPTVGALKPRLFLTQHLIQITLQRLRVFTERAFSVDKH